MKNDRRIEFTPYFTKLRTAAPLAIKGAFRETLELFMESPNHPALRNHALTGKYAGFHSIDVTEDWRAIYRIEGKQIIFVDLGTHEELYG